MNIFYVDHDPHAAAKAMVDKHVVKMVLETAQLLSTTKRAFGEDAPYKATHVNHPSAKWTRETKANYMWLFRHFNALLAEYTFRYGKVHACSKHVFVLGGVPIDLDNGEQTPVPCCMPEQFKISTDPVVNYREYYRVGKSHLHSWKGRQKPEWI